MGLLKKLFCSHEWLLNIDKTTDSEMLILNRMCTKCKMTLTLAKTSKNNDISIDESGSKIKFTAVNELNTAAETEETAVAETETETEAEAEEFNADSYRQFCDMMAQNGISMADHIPVRIKLIIDDNNDLPITDGIIFPKFNPVPVTLGSGSYGSDTDDEIGSMSLQIEDTEMAKAVVIWLRETANGICAEYPSMDM